MANQPTPPEREERHEEEETPSADGPDEIVPGIVGRRPAGEVGVHRVGEAPGEHRPVAPVDA